MATSMDWEPSVDTNCDSDRYADYEDNTHVTDSEDQDDGDDEQHTRVKSRRKAARTEEEKCAEILHDIAHKYEISFSTLLDYIVVHRHEKPVMTQYRALKGNISKMATLGARNDTKEHIGAMGTQEWQEPFDAGLWDVAHALLRKEILSVAEIEEISGNVDDLDNKNWNQEDPIIPVDAIKARAPRTVQLLHEVCQPRERTQRRSGPPDLRICYMVTNMCQLQQKRTCNTIPVMMACFLRANGLSRRALEILNSFGVCCSYKRALKMQDLQMARTKAEIVKFKDDPCVNITIDNCDLADGVNDERVGDHGSHTSATTGLINRGIEMPADGPTQDMLDLKYRVRTLDIIRAGIKHDSLQKLWHFYIFSAIRVAFGDIFQRVHPTRESCLDVGSTSVFQRPIEEQVKIHIKPGDKQSPHRAIPIKPIMINESTTEGMLEIINDIMIKQLHHGESDAEFQRQLFLIHGDQKTVDRLRSCRRLRAKDSMPYDSMKWFLPCLGLWHTKFNYLMLIHETHWHEPNPEDDSHLHASAAFWGRKNMENPRSFRALEELEIQTFQARIAAIFMRNLLKGNRPRTPDDAVKEVTHLLKEMTEEVLQQHVQQIYKEIHEHKHKTPDGLMPDQELWNHIVYLRNFFPYLLLKDGIKYGDIGYLRIATAIMAVYYQGSRSVRYAKEFLHLFTVTDAKGAASPALQHAILANSIVNHRGLRDSHFEKDRELEFLNKFIKESRVRNHSSNKPARDLLVKSALISPQSMLLTARFAGQAKYKDRTRHPEKSASEDVLLLTKRLWDKSINPRRGRQSRFVARDFLSVGMRNLEKSLQSFNKMLNLAALRDSGLVVEGGVRADGEDAEGEDELDTLRDETFRARLDESSASEFNFASDSDASQIE